MIAVVDYGRGNLFSIGQALRHLGAEFSITCDPGRIGSAERVVLPGVGAFADAMAGLRERGLIDSLLAVAGRGVPLLGICLGMQILATRSEEFGLHEGLDLIPGTVRRLREGDGEDRMRVPNVGWRALSHAREDPIAGAVEPGTMMYFVHSFAPFPEDPGHVVASIGVNGAAVPAIIRRGAVIGCQFHPEKSGPRGLELLGRFLEVSPDDLG